MSQPQAAFSLTYDGGDPGHREIVIPALVERGVAATFYLQGDELLKNLPEWQEIASGPHEIGNGAMLDFGVFFDSIEPWQELEATFEECLPGHDHTSALSWETISSQPAPDVPGIVRSGREGFNFQGLTDLTSLNIIRCDDLTGAELIRIAERGIESQSWTIFSFMGVGIGESSVDLSAHNKLLDFLAGQSLPVGSVQAIADLWQPHSIPPLRVG